MNSSGDMKSKNLPTPEEQAKIYSVKNRRQRMRLISRIAYFVIALIILGLMFYAVIKAFFAVDNIVVNGSTVYSKAEVSEACGYSEGDILFSVKAENIQKNIIENLPFVYSVTVEKDYPDTLIINIVDEKESYYFEFDKRYFVITAGLKVLAVFEDEAKLLESYERPVFVNIDDVKEVITTKEVVFFDEESYRRSENVLMTVRESQLYGKITYIDISELYDVKLLYDDRIELIFGSHVGIEKKLVNALEVISRFSDKATGKIYLYGTDEAYAVVDDNN